MELKNFDAILERVPKMSRPMRVILAGSDGENMLKGLFAAQEKGLVQPVLVGDRARTITVLEEFGLEKEPYTMVDTPPGHNITQAAIDIINSGDGDVLMRGNLPTRDFLMPVLDGKNGLRTDRLMSHVSLCSLPEYPKLLALSDMTVVIKPNMTQKKAIIRNTADALKAFGYENPKLALLALVENLQRRDLNFVEEATALAKLIETYHLSQEEAARRIGKSQSAVANKLRLLRLPPDVLTLLRERGCTERHARALLRLEEPELQRMAARHVAEQGLTVARTEEYVEALLHPADKPARKKPTFVIKDVRLFLNTVTRGLSMMKSAGVQANCKRQETEDSILLTITIPK